VEQWLQHGNPANDVADGIMAGWVVVDFAQGDFNSLLEGRRAPVSRELNDNILREIPGLDMVEEGVGTFFF
jgi:hypothetical protein